MSDIGKADRNRLVYLHSAFVIAGAQQLHEPRNIVKVIKRLNGRIAPAHCLARFPLGIRHLDVRAVAQHYV